MLVLSGAAFLRFHQIDRRTLHADEAVQAYQTWQLWRGEGYAYDPADKHGPFLYYAAAGLAKIIGRTPASLEPTWLRSVTLVAGLGTLALILGAAARLGRTTALIGATLLAAAPLAIIYDTYFIQEAWFCFFTWALFFAGLRWWAGFQHQSDCRAGPCGRAASEQTARPQGAALQKSSIAGAVLIGAIVGLMQATKETSVIHFAALGVVLFALGGTRPPGGLLEFAKGKTRPEVAFHLKTIWLHLLAAFLTALVIYVLCYSSFFTHWSGVLDGLRTYFHYAARATDSAHDQPWYYYCALLWPHVREGVSWGEPLLLVMALFGLRFAFSTRGNATHRALAVFTITLLLLYSFIPYKTPWLLLTPYVGLTLLAGLGAAESGRRLPKKLARFVPVILWFALLLECAWRDQAALDRYANDDRNPYVYQPTSPDLARLVTALVAFPTEWKIAVISPDHAWPLPWYLRERKATGYFTTAPAVITDYDLVLYDSRLDVPAPLAATIYGLRPNVYLWHPTQ